MPASCDEVLMAEYQAGSTASFEQLFSRHKEPVFGFFRRRVATRESAEDLAQELWIAVMKGSTRYQPRASFRSYIYAIAFKLLAGERRRNARQSFTAARDIPIASTSTSELWVQEALAQLEPTEREMIMLREYEQLSYQEISELLLIPLNTVRSRLFRARLAVRQLLEPKPEGLRVQGGS